MSAPTSGFVATAPPVRDLAGFAAWALTVGGGLFALSTRVRPDAPFVIAAVLVGLMLPALVLTHREAGTEGLRALVRGCVRPPASWWWLAIAAFGLPVLTWTAGAALGGARPLDLGLVTYYVGDLVVGLLVINLWEELGWTGYFQRRAAARCGALSGALITSVFFTGIHLPLTLNAATSPDDVVRGVLLLAGVAVGVRVLIARVDPWSGRSLLTVGLLHSAFNASENLLLASHFWVRPGVTIACAVAVAAIARPPRPDS